MSTTPVQDFTEPRVRKVIVKELIHEQILAQIRHDIISNRWEPGQRLSEPELCSEFGVSRTPMREALKILETEGLVVLRPHVGGIVTPFDPPDLADKFELLTGLEQLAAAKVARLRDSETLDGIMTLQLAMAQAADAEDTRRYFDLNDQFHRAIILGAKNGSLAQIHHRIMWHVHRARHRVAEYEPLSKTAASNHDPIVSALMNGDEGAAAQAVRTHLEAVTAAVLAKINNLDADSAPAKPAQRRENPE
jgi:DNA-binding GntR family transcriptional regulator